MEQMKYAMSQFFTTDEVCHNFQSQKGLKILFKLAKKQKGIFCESLLKYQNSLQDCS